MSETKPNHESDMRREENPNVMPATSSRMHEMGLNPITLAFSGPLEEAFLDDYYNNSMTMVRLSLFAGIILYGLFGILDAELVPSMKWELWFIRFAIVWPALMAVIVWSYYPSFKKFFQPSVASVMLVAGCAIVIMVAIIPPPTNYSYYAGIILVFIWGYSFTRVRFLWAASAGWIIVIFYEIVTMYYADIPRTVFINNNFFFISAQIIGMFVCYAIEFYQRRDFFLAWQLQNEKAVIIDANRLLESIIQERTFELVKTNQDLRSQIEERQRAETTRKNLESQLLQAQKMEAMGTLAGGIAHDFNNLLMGIQGNVSLILMDIRKDHPYCDRLRNVQELVRSGSQLTHQLLGFARGGKYEVQPTNLNDLVTRCKNMYGRAKKEITIYTNYQENIWTVNADQGQIEQVLLNLFVNAWQAMPGGGNLSVGTENVALNQLDAERLGIKAGRYVKIIVTDTGTGMDQATMSRIFDPFFTTKGMGRGTGLGLASAYGIIKNHEGTIAVQSMKGQGATFEVYLPATDTSLGREKVAPAPKLMKGTETVLYVDDEEMNVETGQHILEALGYTVLTAQSGPEAIDVFKKNNGTITLVILDMVMPGMNGGEVFDVLKDIKPDVKVLLSSGYSITGEATKIMERGCAGFIQKPYDVNSLSVKIRNIMDGFGNVKRMAS
jgi:two-component system cell cycle sensor histidine kinase/response regulator CckA